MKYDETDIAQRYDSARHLPAGTLRLWLEAMARHVPPGDIRTIVDVGCGTGRFSAALADAFDADVIGVDPSLTMLAKARGSLSHPRLDFRDGDAEHLPVDGASACLVYLSMVYHHLGNPGGAAREFTRVLRASGFLCIRNATRDRLDRFPYLQYFPAAVECNRRKLPSQQGVIATMRAHGFSLLRHEVIEQPFADSFGDYYAKIRHRGLSDLAALPDAEFEAGLQQMRQALASHKASGPVIEPIDLFVFAKTAEPSAAADAAHSHHAAERQRSAEPDTQCFSRPTRTALVSVQQHQGEGRRSLCDAMPVGSSSPSSSASL